MGKTVKTVKKIISLLKTKNVVTIPQIVDENKILNGKTAVIVGETGGIGHAIAKDFLESGCKVIITGTNQKKMAEILDKVVKADVIVLSTPVYFYIMNGQMKTFIDRCLPRYEEISNKEFYFICTSVDPDRAVIEKTLSGLRDFTDDCLDNCIERGVICGIDTAVKGAIEDTPAYERAYEIAKNI